MKNGAPRRVGSIALVCCSAVLQRGARDRVEHGVDDDLLVERLLLVARRAVDDRVPPPRERRPWPRRARR